MLFATSVQMASQWAAGLKVLVQRREMFGAI